MIRREELVNHDNGLESPSLTNRERNKGTSQGTES